MAEDVVFLSHINMLYKLYYKGEKLRKEQDEYKKMAKESKYLYQIASILSKHRRMALNEIEKEINTSKKELCDTINMFDVNEHDKPIESICSIHKYSRAWDGPNQIPVDVDQSVFFF